MGQEQVQEESRESARRGRSDRDQEDQDDRDHARRFVRADIAAVWWPDGERN